MRRVGLTFGPQGGANRATGELAAGAYPAAEEVKQVWAGRVWTGAERHPRGCWAAPRLVEHRTETLRELNALGYRSRVSPTPDTSACPSTITLSELHNHHHLEDEPLDPRRTFDEGPETALPPYLSLINTFFKPEKLTKAEMKFKKKAMVEVVDLNNQIEQAQIQQEQLQKESRQLCTEKLLVQAEHKFILEYLTNKTEEYRKQPIKMWNNYVQKSEETELRRQEATSRYGKQTSVLKAELLQKEKTQSLLKHQLKAMKDILILKEKQEIEMLALQEEKRKVQDETAAKTQEVQVQILQEKALLEKQLSEPDISQLGKRKRRELKRKNQALELAAKQYTLEFYRGINRENQQLQKDLQELIQQSQELVACQSQLKNRKQQLQQEQWYLEGLIRGRQRMQGRYNWCLKGQDAPKTTLTPPLGTKSRINPK
ncbi:coiled-coil domain-containing protein 121 [Elephas maximus indicus]|uniref:coiled-coil domain-containing protein 121 n=1 Tax=Elephas maximus indicus TaxID=99487 RepID=UPI002116D84A|nr:coiled-coil domain-containing protein 121 [Elephas maximus indicus]